MTKLLLPILVLFSFIGLSQPKVNWLTMEEAESQNKVTPKPFLVDVYTDWCGWCKKLNATTYQDPQVVGFINENFYAVKFNAETQDTITFQGETYVNKSTANRSTHQLAYKFMPERRSYPTTYFMDETMKINLVVPGYLDSKDMAPFLVFYNEKVYESTNINDFRTNFKKTFESEATEKVKWITMQEALERNKAEKKKILVFLNDDATITGKVMKATSLEDSTVADYLNKNYLAVNFNTRSQEELIINNQKLINNPEDGPYHQLVIAGMNGAPIKFPTCLFFDENNLLITPVSQYMDPNFTVPVITYFKEDNYKDTEFAAYLTEYRTKLSK